MQQKVLYTEDVAVLFGLSPSTVQRRARLGDFPAKKVKGRWVFDPRDLRKPWCSFVGGVRPSGSPSRDFERLRQLVQELDLGDVVGFEAAAQREILALVQRLLATRNPRAMGLRTRVRTLVQHLRENPKFAFLELVVLIPERVYIR